ncbi:MAG: hypothetical protein AABX19_03710 [Nanoarchaeota archaeon]
MKTMKLTFLIIAIMIFSVFSVIAAEDADCDVDLAKYASQAKDFVNNNPDNNGIKYGKSFVGKNAVVELHVDDQVWHAKMVKGMMTDVSQGEVDSKTFTVTTSMCTLKDLQDGKITAKKALKDGKITYQAHGAMNRMKAVIMHIFL